jgi:hypothetical protein
MQPKLPGQGNGDTSPFPCGPEVVGAEVAGPEPWMLIAIRVPGFPQIRIAGLTAVLCPGAFTTGAFKFNQEPG